MTDLWYIKRDDFLRFETLKCPEMTKNFVLESHYFRIVIVCLLSTHCDASVWQNLRNSRALDAVLRQYASSDHVVELTTRLIHTNAAVAASGSVSIFIG